MHAQSRLIKIQHTLKLSPHVLESQHNNKQDRVGWGGVGGGDPEIMQQW